MRSIGFNRFELKLSMDRIRVELKSVSCESIVKGHRDNTYPGLPIAAHCYSPASALDRKIRMRSRMLIIKIIIIIIMIIVRIRR